MNNNEISEIKKRLNTIVIGALTRSCNSITVVRNCENISMSMVSFNSLTENEYIEFIRRFAIALQDYIFSDGKCGNKLRDLSNYYECPEKFPFNIDIEFYHGCGGDIYTLHVNNEAVCEYCSNGYVYGIARWCNEFKRYNNIPISSDTNVAWILSWSDEKIESGNILNNPQEEECFNES